MNFSDYNSIESFAPNGSMAAFTTVRAFREDKEITPKYVTEDICYMPWGADNKMPFDVIDSFEKDETLGTCLDFNAEVCYASGLEIDSADCIKNMHQQIDDFCTFNDLPEYWMGVSLDMMMFAFAVSVFILDKEGKNIVSLQRKEAAYCRFAPADAKGQIRKVLFANWRNAIVNEKDVEVIDIVQPRELKGWIAKSNKNRKFAVVSRVARPDSTYYPIPFYAALFSGHWYNIKQLIGLAKEAKLRNSTSIKYQIEISDRHWTNLFKSEGITDPAKQVALVKKEKQNILDFLTGAENSGKVWFTTFYISPDGKTFQDVKINKIDSEGAQGGDWATDIQEAVNMICFTMRVHSNLVGSVPGKAQSNNSGSDKRELYTIAQSLKKPYRDILFRVIRILINFNRWHGAKPVCKLIQLTTLDEHADAKQTEI